MSFHRILIWMLLFALTACSAPQPIADSVYHRLDYQVQEIGAHDIQHKYENVYVHRVKFAGLLQDDALVYESSRGLQQWHDKLWVEPVSEAFSRFMAKALRQSGIATSVSQRPVQNTESVHLYITVTAFEYQQYSTGKVQVSLEFELRGGASKRQLLVQDFEISETPESEAAKDVVDALSVATQRAIQKIVRAL